MKINGKRFLILLLYSPIHGEKENAPILGRTRLMKMTFIFFKELKGDFLKGVDINDIKEPEFFAWKYGPFSLELLNDLEFLVNQDFICSELSEGPVIQEEEDEFSFLVEDTGFEDSNEYNQEKFYLSNPKGIVKGEEFWSDLNENQRDLMITFKTAMTKAPLYRILEYIYRKYDDKGYIDKSVIRERFFKNV